MAGQVTNPQYQFYDTNNLFDVDIDFLYNAFIIPIDNQRSYFNALTPNSQILNVPQYQESRCHAFFRMMGFPVVASATSFYSPGYDQTLNTDVESTNSYQQIAMNAIDNVETPSSVREVVQGRYNSVWSAGGINATATALGSRYIRSFAKQFSDNDSIGPLDYDATQIQTVAARLAEIKRFYGAATPTNPAQLPNINLSLLTSTHVLKPFIVDPRIDGIPGGAVGIKPASRRIAAPFMLNASQLKIFDPQQGQSFTVKRPYIETVISTIFNSASLAQTAPQAYVNAVINQIKLDPTVTDQDLINMVQNPGFTLYTSQLSAFSSYLNIIRSLVTQLVESIRNINIVRGNINWQPVPSPNFGPESGSEGGSIVAATPGDPNNQKVEFNIIQTMQKQILNQVQYDIGLINNTADTGGFAFSNITDSIFNIQKDAQTSYDDTLMSLNSGRNKLGNDGLDDLRIIEIIMGEFSGIGLLDIAAIQGAMWLVNPMYLMGMLDSRAIIRLGMNSSISGYPTGPDVVTSLTGFEAVVKQMYKLIDSYISVLQVQGQFTDIQNQ